MSLDVIRRLVEADIPVLLWGPPGTGKTSAVMAMAKAAGAHVEVLIGSTLDPLDVGGYLVPSGVGIVAHPPPWAVKLRAALDAGKPAWLVLDELSCAPPTVQAALLRVVQDRAVGALDISGVRVIAASNPEDTAADGGSLSGATANRWAHINWTLSPQEWVQGELSGWGSGHPSKALAQARSDVAGFIQRNPSALLAVPKAGDPELGRAYPTPRSWSAVARACAGAPREAIAALASSLVGKGAAAEYLTHLSVGDLPDPEELLSGRSKLPKRPDALSRSLLSVVSAASVDRDDRDGRVLAAWGILASVRADVALMPARVLLDVVPGVPEVARELGRKILEVRAA